MRKDIKEIASKIDLEAIALMLAESDPTIFLCVAEKIGFKKKGSASYSITLDSPINQDFSPIQAIRIIRAFMGLGLIETRDIVKDCLPYTIRGFFSKEKAEELRSEFNSYGYKAKISVIRKKL